MPHVRISIVTHMSYVSPIDRTAPICHKDRLPSASECETESGRMSKNQSLLGVRIGGGTLQELVAKAMSSVDCTTEPFSFACANPHSLVVARGDPAFRAALAACSAVVADGVGVTLAARVAGAAVGPRITGTDFYLSFMAALNRRGGRVLFFGSSPEVLALVLARARGDYGNLHVDGISPPYGAWSAETEEQFRATIRAAKPDVLWVGMTAPRQEKWVHDSGSALQVPVVGSIGAVFDYYAGTVRRAPAWVCGIGLEWLYRLMREPRRLWRRTVLSAPHFLCLVAHERVALLVRAGSRRPEASSN
jgi:N-acetylglucosaminyldiphosphoundecaprenol N-acetyl-beta-D-mannosaminyltransferase